MAKRSGDRSTANEIQQRGFGAVTTHRLKGIFVSFQIVSDCTYFPSDLRTAKVRSGASVGLECIGR